MNRAAWDEDKCPARSCHNAISNLNVEFTFQNVESLFLGSVDMRRRSVAYDRVLDERVRAAGILLGSLIGVRGAQYRDSFAFSCTKDDSSRPNDMLASLTQRLRSAKRLSQTVG
jgi:hypothetical protein